LGLLQAILGPREEPKGVGTFLLWKGLFFNWKFNSGLGTGPGIGFGSPIILFLLKGQVGRLRPFPTLGLPYFWKIWGEYWGNIFRKIRGLKKPLFLNYSFFSHFDKHTIIFFTSWQEILQTRRLFPRACGPF